MPVLTRTLGALMRECWKQPFLKSRAIRALGLVSTHSKLTEKQLIRQQLTTYQVKCFLSQLTTMQ